MCKLETAKLSVETIGKLETEVLKVDFTVGWQ